ncbi:MAG: hypothetical protein MI757_01265, partial [Pirellulales bacterium]|nr:hypothetical protein [Pirellulales bacterium]
GSDGALDSQPDEARHPAVMERHSNTLLQNVQLLLGELVGRDRVIVEGRFGFGKDQRKLTFRELGERVGVSKERVRQLFDRAMKKLRAAAERHRIDASHD